MISKGLNRKLFSVRVCEVYSKRGFMSVTMLSRSDSTIFLIDTAYIDWILYVLRIP